MLCAGVQRGGALLYQQLRRGFRLRRCRSHIQQQSEVSNAIVGLTEAVIPT